MQCAYLVINPGRCVRQPNPKGHFTYRSRIRHLVITEAVIQSEHSAPARSPDFNDNVVLIAIANYGVRGVQDGRFQSYYSLLKNATPIGYEQYSYPAGTILPARPLSGLQTNGVFRSFLADIYFGHALHCCSAY